MSFNAINSDGSLAPISGADSAVVDQLVTDVTQLKTKINSYLSYIDVPIGNITMPASGYLDIRRFIPTAPSGKKLVFVTLKTYGQGNGALVVDCNGLYVSGNPGGTWDSVAFRYFYIPV